MESQQKFPDESPLTVKSAADESGSRLSTASSESGPGRNNTKHPLNKAPFECFDPNLDAKTRSENIVKCLSSPWTSEDEESLKAFRNVSTQCETMPVFQETAPSVEIKELGRHTSTFRTYEKPEEDDWRAELAAEQRREELRYQLELRKFSLTDEPLAPNPVLSLGGHVISSDGNISVLSSKAKEGKTAAITAIIAAAINPEAPFEKILGFKCSETKGATILHFDTEQSPYDHHRMVKRALRRAEVETTPSNLDSFCITDIDRKDRIDMLEMAMGEAKNLFIVLIDGIAEFIDDPNNGPESFDLVSRLQQLAINHYCPILTVLHENPGTESGKTRGHLGSHLERKAETNLRLSKANGVTTMWVEKGRHCTIPKELGIRFQFCEEAGMHVLAPDESEERRSKSWDELESLAKSVFENAQRLTWTDLRNRIAKVGKMTASGARKKLVKLEEIGLISKLENGGYRLNER